MQARQIAAIQEFTSKVDAAVRYTIKDREYMNGPIVSSIGHTFRDGTVQVSVSNSTDEWRWFYASIHVIAHVTPRGRVTVRLWNGVPRSEVDDQYRGQRVRRQMRKARA